MQEDKVHAETNQTQSMSQCMDYMHGSIVMLIFLVVGAIFGDPNGQEGLQKVCLPNFTQNQITQIVRKYDTAEKLAGGLLLLLFSAK